MQKTRKLLPSKAKINYLLATKLFCGHCKAAMTGISGTSKTGTVYNYYQCVINRRDKSCKKKTVNKDYIENLIVHELRDFLTPSNIDAIATEVVELCNRERDTDNLKHLTRFLSENVTLTPHPAKNKKQHRRPIGRRIVFCVKGTRFEHHV